jgi:hypothetical protein
VRQQQRRLLWLQGALWGAAAALLLAAAGGLVGAWSPGAGRALLVLAPVAFAGVLVAFGVVRALQTVGDDARTARLIGQRHPALSLDVLAAVELERELSRGGGPAAGPEGGADGRGRAPHFSPDLARAFLESLDARAGRVQPREVVDERPLRQAGVGLGATAVLLGVLALLAGARLQEGFGRVLAAAPTTAGGAPEREPITGDVELTYHYPQHTGLSPRTVAGTRGDIAAPAGTEVHLKTRSDRPVERAELVVNGQALPLAVTGGRDLAGKLVVDKPGSYHVAFQDARGREVARGPDVPVTVEADAAPTVQLKAPREEELEVDPGQRVELRWEAQDDFGLSGLQLVFRGPRAQGETRVPLPREDGRRSQGSYTWDLAALKLQPGERVTYYVEARDNDQVAGPKPGVSRTQVVKLYSAAEKRRVALEKAAALWEKLVGHLGDRLEGPEREEKRDAARVAAASAVDEKGLTLMEEMREVARELSNLRDAPPEVGAALANISSVTGRKVRATSDFRKVYARVTGRRGGQDAFDVGRRLGGLVEEEVAAVEKDVLYLESLLDRQRLQDLKDLGQQLSAERRELASLIEQYKQAPNEQLRAEVLQQVQALRERMEELSRRMSELAKGIRDEHLNAEAMQELMEEKDMGSSLDDVERLMREGKSDEALAKLQELAMQMEQMLQNLDQADSELGAEQFPELAEKFQGFMQELQETTRRQEEVAKQSQAIRDRAREQNRDRLRQKGQAVKQELQSLLDRAAKDYQGVPPDALNRQALVELERAQSELQSAEGALKADDFDLAQEAVERAAEAAERLAAYGSQQRSLDELYQNPPEVKAQSEKLAERLERDRDLVEDAQRKLQQLFPQPGSQLSQGDRQQLQQLSKEQRQLEQQAQGLGQKLEEMQQMAPLFDEGMMEQMGQVGERMGQAAQRMEGKDAQRGHGEARAAAEGLKQFQQQMQQGQQGQGKGRGLPLPMMAGRRPGGSGNGQASREKVELPDEEQFQAPREFRKDLLDAMKEGAPDRYRDQVKRFYEELVK